MNLQEFELFQSSDKRCNKIIEEAAFLYEDL
jgi:hypothetical protein